MNLHLHKSKIKNQKETIKITGSKSESNRLLILKALYPNIDIENLSNSDDTKLLQRALQTSTSNSNSSSIDIHHAGTAMRFLTAYFACQEHKEVVLTGSSRMKERPIKILVEALLSLGADITYLENEGYPPLKIIGKKLSVSKVELPANVSSQYISALMLIAPKLEHGLTIKLKGKITSVPYINMTLSLIKQLGIEADFSDHIISIIPKQKLDKTQHVIVESDWSSASYWFSMIALSPVNTSIELFYYLEQSIQGDSALVEIYKEFGVETIFSKTSMTLTKTKMISHKKALEFDLTKTPDIAQTIAVSAFGLGMSCHLTGLHTLKIKETDRLLALKNELEKFGAQIEITENSLLLHSSSSSSSSSISIETYNDHRMAMSFAPLALKTSLVIKDAKVVSKSYPEFWDHLKKIGISFKKLSDNNIN